jgi:sugar phosphate isomerase/epimerase
MGDDARAFHYGVNRPREGIILCTERYRSVFYRLIWNRFHLHRCSNDGANRRSGEFFRMADIVIVASAFGIEAVRRSGHRTWLKVAADAGAAGFEVRRELIAGEGDASLDALARLGAEIEELGLWTVYSTPATLYDERGILDADALASAQAEADALGARFVKMQLGAFASYAGAVNIRRATAGGRARVVVENGQRAADGSLARFVAFFAALEQEGAGQSVGMTFDIGNWHWTGELPLAAARVLAPRVEYIHCKGVAGSGMRRFATAPAADDPFIAALFAVLPRDVPRGIEFPLDQSDLADDAKRRVAWLTAA